MKNGFNHGLFPLWAEASHFGKKKVFAVFCFVTLNAIFSWDLLFVFVYVVIYHIFGVLTPTPQAGYWYSALIWEELLGRSQFGNFIHVALGCVVVLMTLYTWTSHKRTPSGPPSSVHIHNVGEKSAFWEVKNAVFQVAVITTKCPLRRGVHLWELSVSRGSTVILFTESISKGGAG